MWENLQPEVESMTTDEYGEPNEAELNRSALVSVIVLAVFVVMIAAVFILVIVASVVSSMDRASELDQEHIVQYRPPNRPSQTKRQTAQQYESLGNTELQTGEAGKALASYENALESRRELAVANPNDPLAQRNLYFL